ncbi:hypothetical protein DNTS_021466 [Danionella cerebrum]|uniref:LITAF domain-containing protein n=1 Tax=Danionella cerebrum TaxID=2873325 RepID=A0A553R2N6_9TELE|nr:hypothetical protein DNTS_021466 [Danionella translucida]
MCFWKGTYIMEDHNNDGLDLEELEEMAALEAFGAIETHESAPPYPGLPVDYGATMTHTPPYYSSPYPNVNMGYSSYPEPGVNLNFQGGPPKGIYPPVISAGPGMYTQATSPGIYPQATSPTPGMYPQPTSPIPGAHPQPPNPTPAAPPQTTTVTTSVMLPGLRDLPAQTVCPHCKHQVITITEHFSGLMAWAACGCLALVGCWPCCIVPFWMDSCKDVEHRCPNCNTVLSFYRRL